MEESSYAPSRTTTRSPTRAHPEALSTNEAVDRHTSVRSVMTLPPYNPTPHAHERLIAREGEREGVDTVIEFPETAEEEEERREEEMDSLFQIRQARRAEIAERNERRRERAEARAAGDWARLEQLRLQSQMRSRARAESNASATSSVENVAGATGAPLNPTASASTLIAEHHARTASRERRVSSVSYADLGLARHDGTRIRADSVESDHRPLLASAAAMGGDATSRPSSSHRPANRFINAFHHTRAASAESVMSTDSDLPGEVITPQTSSAERSGSDPIVHTPSASASGGDSQSEPSPPMPVGQPPEYEDAPPYTSPVAGQGENIPRLPSVRVNSSLPAIEITGSTPAATPILASMRGSLHETAP